MRFGSGRRNYWCALGLRLLSVFCRGHLRRLRCSMIGLVSGQDLNSAMMANSSSSPPMAASSVWSMHSREWWCIRLGWADNFEPCFFFHTLPFFHAHPFWELCQLVGGDRQLSLAHSSRHGLAFSSCTWHYFFWILRHSLLTQWLTFGVQII